MQTAVALIYSLSAMATCVLLWWFTFWFAVPGTTVKFGWGAWELEKPLSVLDEHRALQKQLVQLSATEDVTIDFRGNCGAVTLLYRGVRAVFHPRLGTQFPEFGHDTVGIDGVERFAPEVLRLADFKAALGLLAYQCKIFSDVLDDGPVMAGPVVVVEEPVPL